MKTEGCCYTPLIELNSYVFFSSKTQYSENFRSQHIFKNVLAYEISPKPIQYITFYLDKVVHLFTNETVFNTLSLTCMLKSTW